MKKKIVLISLILVMATLLLMGSVRAENLGTINFDAIKSTDGEPVENLEVSVYKVSKKDEYGNILFEIGFENCKIDIDDLSGENIERIKTFAKTNAEPLFIETTGTNGKFVLENLELGTYLLVQNNNLETVTMQTMLITVPELTVEHGLKYEITAKPKINEVSPEEPEIPVEDELPATGTLDWLVPILVAAGLLIFCIAWLKVYATSKKKVD